MPTLFIFYFEAIFSNHYTKHMHIFVYYYIIFSRCINCIHIRSSDAYPDPKNHFEARVINGVIYAPGGQHHYEPGGMDAAGFHAYEGEGWRALASLPEPRSHTLTVRVRVCVFMCA